MLKLVIWDAIAPIMTSLYCKSYILKQWYALYDLPCSYSWNMRESFQGFKILRMGTTDLLMISHKIVVGFVQCLSKQVNSMEGFSFQTRHVQSYMYFVLVSFVIMLICEYWYNHDENNNDYEDDNDDDDDDNDNDHEDHIILSIFISFHLICHVIWVSLSCHYEIRCIHDRMC